MQQLRRNGSLVCRVQIEVAGAYHQVFGVGCFQNQQPPGHQHPLSLLHDFLQLLKANVFGNVKAGDDALAVVGQL